MDKEHGERIIGEQSQLVPEFVCSSRLDKSTQQQMYKIKWKGLPIEQAKWIPEHLILEQDRHLIDKYLQQQGGKKKRSILQSGEISVEVSAQRELAENESSEIQEVRVVQMKRKVRKATEQTFQLPLQTGHSNKKMSYEVLDRHTKIKFGSFDHDVPLCISNHNLDQRFGEKEEDPLKNIRNFYYKVDWRPRENGYRPKGSYYLYQELKKACPRLLLEYFEKIAVLRR